MPKKEKKKRILICLVGHSGGTLNSVLSHTPPAMSSLTHFKSFDFPFHFMESFLEIFLAFYLWGFYGRSHDKP